MIIYQIINKTNGKLYIGKTTNYKGRINDHFNLLRENKHYNSHMQRSFNKYGEGNFIPSIIDKASTNKELNEKEIEWIKLTNSSHGDFGYNLTHGGDGGRQTDETIEKMKKSFKTRKRPPMSEETKKKIGDANRGKVGWSRGKTLGPCKERTKQKISNSNKGRKHTEEEKEILRERSTGKKHTLETRKKMSIKANNMTQEHKDNISKAQKGKKVSQECRDKISKTLKGKYIGKNHPGSKAVLQYDLEGNFIAEYINLKQAHLITRDSTIASKCKGRVKNSKTYIWKYKEEK